MAAKTEKGETLHAKAFGYRWETGRAVPSAGGTPSQDGGPASCERIPGTAPRVLHTNFPGLGQLNLEPWMPGVEESHPDPRRNGDPSAPGSPSILNPARPLLISLLPKDNSAPGPLKGIRAGAGRGRRIVVGTNGR